jgi:hypothetical protein
MKYLSGSVTTEFLIIAPMISILGLLGVQYAMIYHARANLSYAAFEAARAGAIHHADPKKIRDGLIKGLLPYLLSTRQSLVPIKGDHLAALNANAALLNQAVKLTEEPFIKIEIINPTPQAFQDFNSPALQQKLGTGMQKVIPNADLDQASAVRIKSGMNLQDANVLKLRVTYGYQPKIPLVSQFFSTIDAFLKGDKDPFSTRLLAFDRIPIVVDVTTQMLSPAIEAKIPTNHVSIVPTEGLPNFFEHEKIMDKVSELIHQDDVGMPWDFANQKPDLTEQVITDLLGGGDKLTGIKDILTKPPISTDFCSQPQ